MTPLPTALVESPIRRLKHQLYAHHGHPLCVKLWQHSVAACAGHSRPLSICYIIIVDSSAVDRLSLYRT